MTAVKTFIRKLLVRWRKAPLRAIRYTLSRGRALTLHAVDGPMHLRVGHGILWLTGEGVAGDLIVQPGEEWSVPRRGHVVVEALRDSCVLWVPKVLQDGESRVSTSRGCLTMACAPAARSSDSGRNPHVAPTANIPAARAVSMSVAVSPK